jgi:hypothetical protein
MRSLVVSGAGRDASADGVFTTQTSGGSFGGKLALPRQCACNAHEDLSQR